MRSPIVQNQPSDADVANAWPWAVSVRTIVQAHSLEFSGTHLMIGSDYSGADQKSRYYVYSFLLVDTDLSPSWPHKRREFRRQYLPDGRRLSFKRLGDRRRRIALKPFLELTGAFHGRCVAIVVHKDLLRLSTGTKTLEPLTALLSLRGRWRPRSFEAMVRVAHLCGLLVSAWSKPGVDVSWVTDEDEILANDQRHSDLIKVSAWLTGLYSPHSFGEFAVVSTKNDPGQQEFEDVIVVPDLTCGALAEAVSIWSTHSSWKDGSGIALPSTALSSKTNLICAWLWEHSPQFARQVILVDKVGEDRFQVCELGLRG